MEAIPIAVAMIGAAGGMYSSNQQQKTMENAADENYQRQIEFQNRQIQNQLASEGRQKDWITQQQTAQSKASADQQARNEELYKSYAYPKAAEIEAKRNQYNADFASEKSKRLDSLARNASLRGWGAGSGALGAAAGQVESDYLTALGKANNELTQFANKSQFAYPFTSTAQFTPMSYNTGQGISGYSSGSGGLGYGNMGTNPLSTVTGLAMGMNWDKLLGNSDKATTGISSSYYEPFSYNNYLGKTGAWG